MPLFHKITDYSDGHGNYYQAVIMPWDDVRYVLGHSPRGTREEDLVLTSRLMTDDAPHWITSDDAEGFVDETGWGLFWHCDEGRIDDDEMGTEE